MSHPLTLVALVTLTKALLPPFDALPEPIESPHFLPVFALPARDQVSMSNTVVKTSTITRIEPAPKVSSLREVGGASVVKAADSFDRARSPFLGDGTSRSGTGAPQFAGASFPSWIGHQRPALTRPYCGGKT